MTTIPQRGELYTLTTIRAPVTKENVEALLLGDVAYLSVFIPFVSTYGKWTTVRCTLTHIGCIHRYLMTPQGSWISLCSLQTVLIAARLVLLYQEYSPASSRPASPPTTTTPTKRGHPRSPRRT